ncbi:uncharacterized protein MAM_06129 [Metarhizium album ARSEF 1941]|uniref:Uncharacterized protein n=1 Tax=Metarhizium album (strain ARSEF 1941) TaxID=1081103 RepID=A0A0B2WQW7_METAS|nr:uncharacterized protein MAM_06129 [Metarhizium album ARSEF 1941]KHN96024.1 hypothetical protein MAM_06129 [Metarhizium album ARSEF 1941]
MRYEDWDILLFPQNSKVPVKEFKVACHVVHDPALDRESIWPHIVAHSFDFSKSGDLEPLSFPGFREELLQQNYWSPADDLGRIKLVLSEGFPRDSITTPIERVKNIVAFSFQHAPLEVLESSSIAWPNPSMWRRAPFAASMQVPTLQPDDSESHAHSPQRRVSGSDKLNRAMNSFQATGASSALVSGGRRVTHPVYGPCFHSAQHGLDAFGNAGSYFEWLNGMDVSMSAGVGDHHCNNLTRTSVAQRSKRRTSTDVSMPDYIPVKSDSQCAEQQMAPETFPCEDGRQNAQHKVPANTSTASDIGYKREGRIF